MTATRKTLGGAGLLERMASITVPLEGECAQLSVGTTVARFQVPDEWIGRVVDFTLIGGAGSIVFGDSAVTAVYNDTATVTSEVITLDDSHGRPLVNGVSVPVFIEDRENQTHFAVDCDTDSIIIHCAPSSPKP